MPTVEMNNISDKNIAQIKKEIALASEEEYPELIKILYADEREGVKKLALSLNKKLEKYLVEQKRVLRMQALEKKFRTEGYALVAGCDEAGRGPLCGPVVSAVVILPDDFSALYINDSKQLSEKKRDELYKVITENAVCWEVGIVDSKKIDEINILNATKLSIEQALERMKIKPDLLLLDALEVNTAIPQHGYVKGDANVYSIAAASIVAKVTRDRIMYEYDKLYPEYGFASNKGYGTAEHIEAIKKYGLTPIHRRSFLKDIAAITPPRQIGNRFEERAAEYLIEKGYSVVARNVKRGSGEMDIICLDKNELVIVEVKARSSEEHGSALEQVDEDKVNRLRDAANIYISEKSFRMPVRFDIITFDMQKNQRYILRHYKNAF